MRHKKLNTKLNRTNKHRKATVSNIMRGLFTNERIVTTIKKAKVTSRYADKIITLAKKNNLAAIRKVESIFQDKDLTYKIFHEIGPRFTERAGGYTRVLRYKTRRGDGTEMAILELTEREVMSPEERTPKSKSKKHQKTPAEKTVVEEVAVAPEQPQVEQQPEGEVEDAVVVEEKPIEEKTAGETEETSEEVQEDEGKKAGE